MNCFDDLNGLKLEWMTGQCYLREIQVEKVEMTG